MVELFSELYVKQNGDGMNQEQEEYLKGVIAKIWEEGK